MAIFPTMMRQYEPFDPMQTLLPTALPTMSMQQQQVMPSTQVPVTQRPGLAGDFESVAELRGLLGPELAYRRGDPSRTLSAQNVSSVYSKPSLNPSLDYAMRGDQQGYYFVTNKGKAAKTKASKSGFIPLNPNWQYRIVNERGKNQVVASGTGEQGLQDVYSMAQRLSAEQGKKANWKVEVFDPSVGSWKVYADDDPPGKVGKILGDVALGAGVGLLGAATGGLGLAALPAAGIGGALGGGLSAAGVNVTDVALPVAATMLFPGLGPVLAPTLGSAASSVAQGRSLEDVLLRSAITAGTAGLMNVTGADRAISNALADAFSPAIAPVVGETTSGAVAPALNEIIVSGSRSVLPSVIASGAGSLASTLPDLTRTLVDLPDVTAPPTEASSALSEYGEPITVLGDRLTEPAVSIADVVNSLGSGTISQLFPTQSTPEPEFVSQGDPIVVEENRIPDVSIGDILGNVSPSVLDAIIQTQPTPEPEFVPQDEGIVVERDRIPDVSIGDILGNVSPSVLDAIIQTQPTPEPEFVPQDEGIVVERDRIPPVSIEDILSNVAPGVIETLATALPDLTGTPIETETPTGTGNSLLDDIIKYYSLGSIGLDALGGLLGGGGGGAGQAGAPYVSQLGPMPTFARGGFTPYTGDYETYGFGPEFNFFGGSAPTAPPLAAAPTAPAMGLLGPNTPTYTPLI